MRGHLINIVIFSIVSVCLLIIFSDIPQEKLIPIKIAKHGAITNFTYYTESSDQSTSNPTIVKKKYKPRGLKVKIYFTLFMHPWEPQYSESSDYNHSIIDQILPSKLSHVPYLPRDPTLA